MQLLCSLQAFLWSLGGAGLLFSSRRYTQRYSHSGHGGECNRVEASHSACNQPAYSDISSGRDLTSCHPGRLLASIQHLRCLDSIGNCMHRLYGATAEQRGKLRYLDFANRNAMINVVANSSLACFYTCCYTANNVPRR